MKIMTVAAVIDMKGGLRIDSHSVPSLIAPGSVQSPLASTPLNREKIGIATKRLAATS